MKIMDYFNSKCNNCVETEENTPALLITTGGVATYHRGYKMSIYDNGIYEDVRQHKIKIPANVCNAKLTPFAFRVYCHLANSEKKYPKTIRAIAKHTGLNKATILASVRELLALDFIYEYSYSDDDAVALIQAKQKQFFECGMLECSWCGGTTTTLEEHHYPVRRSHGGSKTVNICANCHAEFHSLTDNRLYAVKDV